MSKKKNLTPKQELFCQEYTKDWNATQAYIRAGYSRSGADVSSSKLLGKSSIKERIRNLVNPRFEQLGVTREIVLNELTQVALSNITDFITIRKTDEGEDEIYIHDFDEIPRELKSAISEIQKTEHGIKIKLHSKIQALQILAEYTSIIKSQETKQEENENIVDEFKEIAKEIRRADMEASKC